MRHSECLYIWIKRIMVFFLCVLPLKRCYRRCRCRPRRRRYASAFVAFNALNDSDFWKGNAQIFHGHAYNYLRKWYSGMSGKTLRYILDNSPRKKRNKLELVTVNEKSIEMNLSSWREKKEYEVPLWLDSLETVLVNRYKYFIPSLASLRLCHIHLPTNWCFTNTGWIRKSF